MALGNVKFLDPAQFGSLGARKYAVAAGTTASINAGEPVGKALGAAVVATLANAKPVVLTDYMAGISTTTSTETASAAGTVDVINLIPGVVYLCAPSVAADIDTQAEYDAIVGDRVLFSKSSGVYTVVVTTGSDSATSGLVVEPLDIKLYPGQVAFSIRAAVSYMA